MKFTARTRPGLQKSGEAELYLDARTGTFRYVTDTTDAAIGGTGGGGGVSDHTALTNLPWTSSGHTGTASRLAGFSGAGAATYYQIGVDVQAWDADLDAVAGGTWAGATSITTLGTVTTGTWSATAIGPTKGGTGQTSYTTGDILYASATNTLSKLPAGTEGASLTMQAGVPAWVVLGIASAIRISSSTNTPLTGGDVYADNADGNASAFINASVP